MRVGQTFKRQGIVYTVYKQNYKGDFLAEDEFGINLICIPSYLNRIK